MRIENNKVVLEREDCLACREGKEPGRKKCPYCHGTGRRGRSKCRNCGYTPGTVPDFDNPVPCSTCKGQYQGYRPEDMCSYLPKSVWPSFTFRVYRSERAMTLNEKYIGAGCVFSCVDYGRAWGAFDHEVIDEVKKHTGQQACKVAKEDGTLCDHIGIFVTPGGYSVRAMWTPAGSVVQSNAV